MQWSKWIECKFNTKGELDLSNLQKAPTSAGLYAIGTNTGNKYNTYYVGRSKNSIRTRLKSHLSGKDNKVIASILNNKKERPNAPTQPKALYFTFLEIFTEEEKETIKARLEIMEAIYITATDRPIANLIKGAKLPEGLRETDVFRSPLED